VTGAGVTPESGKTAAVSGTPTIQGNSVIVNLTNVADAQRLTVTLFNVTTAEGSGDVALRLRVLLGDTTGDGAVNSGDATQTRERSGQLADTANFRSDVNTDGTVNSGDAFIVRARSGNSVNP
jgi:hypothetical protein